MYFVLALVDLSEQANLSIHVTKREQKKSQGRLNSKQKSDVATQNKVQCYNVPIQLMHFVLTLVKNKRKKNNLTFSLSQQMVEGEK